MRDIAAVQCLDDAPLTDDALVARLGCRGWRDTKSGPEVAAAYLVDLVLRTAGDETVLDRRTRLGQAGVVHPRAEPGSVNHRSITGCPPRARAGRRSSLVPAPPASAGALTATGPRSVGSPGAPASRPSPCAPRSVRRRVPSRWRRTSSDRAASRCSRRA